MTFLHDSAPRRALPDARATDSQSPGWRILLKGAQRLEALDAVRRIAGRLCDLRAATLQDAGDLVLFWAYVCDAINEPWADDAFERAAAELAAQIDTVPRQSALFGGLAGAAWVAQHIAADTDDAFLQFVDEHLRGLLEASTCTAHYDLIGGLVGYGAYFLERAPRPSAAEGLATVVSQLRRSSSLTRAGRAWRTAPELLPNQQQAVFPNGYFNLGLAHGAPGVVALLAAVVRCRISSANAGDEPRRLLEEALTFVLAHEGLVNEAADSIYPWAVDVPETAGPAARTAWCYGDLGVAVALARAAAALEDPVLERRSRALARICATRATSACGVHDLGLCHGAAGMAHVLNRLWQHFDDDALAEGARRWFAHALDALERGENPNEPGILEGLAGVGLALLAGGHTAAPDWDRRLLVDLDVGRHPLAAR